MVRVKSLSCWLCVGLLGAFIFFLDYLSKRLVFDSFPTGHFPIVVFQDFLGGIDLSITYATNTGAAWGLFGAHQNLLLAFRILLVIILGYYLFFVNREKKFTIPLMCIFAGALGNICDFFLYGHVVDMIHFVFYGYDYPVFNIADSFIFIGTFSILFLLLFEKKK